jgi:medium-chain acyl-[acyl-carrier-protein] hydrolase
LKVTEEEAMSNRNSPWIVRRTPRDGASLRLFCFPHAGAGSVIFRDWYGDFPESVDVCAIEPPGRLARRKDRAIGEMGEFTQALSSALLPYLDVPFAFLGYSLGSLMAFECARSLRRHNKLEPAHLIVAAHKAPQMPRRQAPIGREPKHIFVRELEARYGAFEPVIKADPEMLDMIVDIMRVDLGMLENYRYQDDDAFQCPILAIAGDSDASMIPAELEAWRAHTTGPFRAQWMQGGHFFLRNRGPELRSLVRDAIRPEAASTSAQL